MNNGAGQTAVLNLGAITRTAPGGAADFNGTGTITTTTLNTAYAGGSSPATILGGFATFGGGATFAVTSTVAGTNTVTGLSTFSPTFSAGTDVDSPIGASAPAALTINSLRLNSAGAYTIGSTGLLTIASGGILETATVGNNAATISGTLTSGNGVDLIVHQYNTQNTLTISSIISGAIGLTKTGPGVLILSGVNTFTGGINISGGTLSASISQLNNASAASPIGAAGAHAITLNNNASFQLTGNNLFNPQAGSSTITIGSGGGTLDIVGTGNITLDDAGQFISAAGGTLNKIGTGTLQVGNATASTNTGAVNVNAGTLKLVNSGTGFLNVSPLVTIATGAAFDIDGTTGANRPLVLSGTGLASAPIGVLTNSSGTASTYLGNVTLAAASSIGGNAGAISVSGNIGGAFALTKVGSSSLTLSGANTFTGGIAVAAGSLSLANATGSGAGTGNVTLNAAGGTNLLTGATGTMSGTLVGATSGTTTTIAPGGLYVGSGSTANIGSLTVGGLTLTSNATNLVFDLNTVASSDKITVTNTDALTVSGANKVPILIGRAPSATGIYTLISFNQMPAPSARTTFRSA